MSEFFSMGGDGAYVWTAYGITLAVIVWNAWSVRSLLKRNLRTAATEQSTEEPARRPTVRQL